MTPLPRTLLSLSRYARIMGINPVHFFGGYGDQIWPIESSRCTGIWPQYSWQHSDQVSRYDLAEAILEAENEMARILGFFPAPTWVSKEIQLYPKTGLRRPTYPLYHSGRMKSVALRWKKFIQPGQRTVDALELGAPVIFTDDDGDGFSETATIVVPAADELDSCKIKTFFAGYGGDIRWEVRSPRSVAIIAGVATIKIDTWLLIKPELQAAPKTTEGFKAIHIDDPLNFVGEVDVYYEYAADPSAELIWEPCNDCSSCGGCTACVMGSQSACLHVRDIDNSIVVPMPASWNEEDTAWELTKFESCRTPDIVRVWYLAGDVSQEFRDEYSCDPLSDFWAQAIAWLATARLERPFCACGNTASLAENLRKDIAYTGDDTSYIVDFGLLGNPFGTRVGEIRAWKRVSALGERIFDGVVF